jgi:hypothetical protein
MRKSKALKIIESIALREGIGVAEVRSEMQKAIDLAFESSDGFWKKWRGRKPTPEEFIVAANKEVLDRMNFGSSKTYH